MAAAAPSRDSKTDNSLIDVSGWGVCPPPKKDGDVARDDDNDDDDGGGGDDGDEDDDEARKGMRAHTLISQRKCSAPNAPRPEHPTST